MPEEWFDALNEDGSFKEKKLRSHVHRDGDWHRVTHLWVVNKYEFHQNSL